MTTRITDNGITVLVPDEGMRLTNGEIIAEGEVYLSGISSPNNWREITVEEAERLMESIAAQQEMLAHEQQMMNDNYWEVGEGGHEPVRD